MEGLMKSLTTLFNENNGSHGLDMGFLQEIQDQYFRQLQSFDPTIGKAALYLINKMDYETFGNHADIDVWRRLVDDDFKNGITWVDQLHHVGLRAPQMKFWPFFEDADIDFTKTGVHGGTVFRSVLEKLLLLRNDDTIGRRNFNDQKYYQMRTNVENLFQSMVVKAEKDGFDTDELLEKPNAYGDTVFTIASNTSQKIIGYILTRPKIDLRYTGPNFDAPCATFYPKFTEQILKRGLCPLILSNSSEENQEMLQINLLRNDPDYAGIIDNFEYKNGVYFSMRPQECPGTCPNASSECPSRMKQFNYRNGFYIDYDDLAAEDGSFFESDEAKELRLGDGAFGTVFCSKWHGQDSAFKYISLERSSETTSNFEHTMNLLTNVRHQIEEYETQLKAEGKYILHPIGQFRQQFVRCINNEWVARNYQVFVYPKCKYNLEDLPYEFKLGNELKKEIMIQCLESLKILRQHNIKHNDIKPSNFLVDFDGDEPTSENIKVYLTDFGLVGDKGGGTPGFASPECISGTILEKSDIFSIGRLFLCLICEDNWCFIALLIVPMLSESPCESYWKKFFDTKSPVLDLIMKMQSRDPLLRPSIEFCLETIKENDIFLIGEDKVKEMEKLLVHDQHDSQFEAWKAIVPRDEDEEGEVADEDDGVHDGEEERFGYLTRKAGLRFTEQITISFKNFITDGSKLPNWKILNPFISSKIHDQANTNLCWAYSISTMIKQSLSIFFDKYKVYLDHRQIQKVQSMLKDDSFHLQLRNEIWLIALSRSVKYKGYQGYVVHNALFRLVHPTMTDPRGISMLGSVRKIFDVCNLDLDDVVTKIEQFKIDDGRNKYYKAPENSRTLVQALENNLTPVVWKTGEAIAHALVIDSIQKTDQNESLYICKNTLQNENGEYTYQFPVKYYDGAPEIQEAFYLHFDHVKISETELSKSYLQSNSQPSRLEIKADFEKYNDVQAISNLASVIKSKSLADKSKKIENENKFMDKMTNQYRQIESNWHSNNDLVSGLSKKGNDRPQVTKFSVLDTEAVTGLETANQRRLDAHKLPLQSELTFEILKHRDQANQMVEMGFTDFSKNIYALIKSSGCINGAIDYIESKKSQTPLNEQLNQISSELSKLGYKSPTEPAKSSHQGDLQRMISQISTMKSRVEEMKNQKSLSGMENLQELQKFSKTAISTFERLQNLIPNALEDKESLEKLENLKQVIKECDDLNPKNDIEEKMLKVDRQEEQIRLFETKTDTLIRDMQELNIICFDPDQRKACVEDSRNQQSHMKQMLEKVEAGSSTYNRLKSGIKKIELACKEFEEDSFGYLRSGVMDDMGMSDVKNSLLDILTRCTEGKSLPP